MRILPDLQCSLVCEDVRREANGKFILIGVVNFILTQELPIEARFLVFNQWTAGYGQFRETMRILAPDHQTILAKSEMKFAMRDAAQHAQNLSGFGLRFETPGVYTIEVLVDDVLKLRYPLPVAIVQPPPGAKPDKAPPDGGAAPAEGGLK